MASKEAHNYCSKLKDNLVYNFRYPLDGATEIWDMDSPTKLQLFAQI